MQTVFFWSDNHSDTSSRVRKNHLRDPSEALHKLAAQFQSNAGNVFDNNYNP
jgi:hypothetical protein